MGNMATTMCVNCQTFLNYPPSSQLIQCPKCNVMMSTNPDQRGQVPQSMPQTSMVPPSVPTGPGSSPVMSYINCVTCGILLSHPRASTVIQCPKCHTRMKVEYPGAAGNPEPPAPAEKEVTRGKNSKPKKRKDPNAPKRAANAYMIFCRENRPDYRARHPDLSFGQIGAELGSKWRSMTPDEKQVYEEKAARDRERYRKDMAAYQTRQAGGAPPPEKKVKTDAAASSTTTRIAPPPAPTGSTGAAPGSSPANDQPTTTNQAAAGGDGPPPNSGLL
jgi:LSD1 subclass zinc finger protein